MYSLPTSTPEANMGTAPLVNGFLMWFQSSFQQKKPLSSKMQEHFLATYHPFPKLCIPGCPYSKYKIIQPLGLCRGTCKGEWILLVE